MDLVFAVRFVNARACYATALQGKFLCTLILANKYRCCIGALARHMAGRQSLCGKNPFDC